MPKEDRGFASMNPRRQREIASAGGRAAQAKKTAHRWSSDEAREAGRKGGLSTHARRKAADPAIAEITRASDMAELSTARERSIRPGAPRPD